MHFPGLASWRPGLMMNGLFGFRMELTTIIATVAFLAGAALMGIFWALPYVYRTRHKAQEQDAKLKAALENIRQLQEEHNRAEYLDERRNMMQTWASCLNSLAQDASVTPINRAAA